MFCLLHQAYCLGIYSGGMPQYSNYRIPGDENRVIFRTYCDLSDVSSSIIKILLVFFFNRSSGFGDDICSVCWDTGLDDTPNLLLLSVFEWGEYTQLGEH